MAKPKIFTEEEKQEIIYKYSTLKQSAKVIGQEYGCSNTTLLKNLAAWGVKTNSRTLDLTGKQYGELYIIEPAPKRKDKYTRWKCQCSCGNITEVRTDYLTNGHTTSCGHTKQQYFRKKDLTGMVFGYLTVLGDIPPEYKKCQCKCGNIIKVETSNLISGNTKSCGCYQKERASESSYIDHVGEKFGKLTVVERVANNRFGHVCYKCKCDCGGTTIVESNKLVQGVTSSCGCLKSKGEMIINNWLTKHNINFKPQVSFKEIILDSNKRPFYDFCVYNEDNSVKCLIEYNGIQHYEYKTNGGWNNKENFEKTQHRDQQKIEQAKLLNYPLHIIKYDENIEERLKEIFNIKEVNE